MSSPSSNFTRPCHIVGASSESEGMRKFIVYRDHGSPAHIEADEDVAEATKAIIFRRKGNVIAKFHWENIHGWEENLTKPRAKSTTAKK